jgi:hypothetical protein
MYRLFFIILTLQFIVLTAYAQQRGQLPNVAITQNKNTVELKWFCQYEGVHAISIERSLDSGENYNRIGEPNTIKKGEQLFTDTHPVCGSNWYRVQLEFNSGLLWNSQVAKIYMDSNQFYFNKKNLPIIPEQDSLFTGKKKNTLLVANDTNIDNIDAYSYFKSLYINTLPANGNILVTLNDGDIHNYTIKFLDQYEHFLFQVDGIKEKSYSIDKRNFPRKGVYKFQLYKNKEVLEIGYVSVFF